MTKILQTCIKRRIMCVMNDANVFLSDRRSSLASGF